MNSRLFIWLLLALPSMPMALLLTSGPTAPDGRPILETMIHPTGEFAARFMIVALIITPMRMLMPKSRFWVWMLKRRRYFGVAAFAYAAAHTVFYVLDMETLQAILGEFWVLDRFIQSCEMADGYPSFSCSYPPWSSWLHWSEEQPSWFLSFSCVHG